jgi:Cu-Zn family superoxide dismutase
MRVLGTTTAILLLAGCMTGGTSGPSRGSALASLTAADGAARGSAQIDQGAGGLRVDVKASSLPPGMHGIHLHTTGRCDAPDFASAGPHWNPTERKHGTGNPAGPHHGDLPNIGIGANGRGALSFTVPAATLDQLLDADGAALVIHANADDNQTDPSGNSGGRIACGVVRLP